MGLNLDYTLESPGEHLKLLMPGPWPRLIKLEFLKVGPRHGWSFKAPQLVIMCSHVLELLVQSFSYQGTLGLNSAIYHCNSRLCIMHKFLHTCLLIFLFLILARNLCYVSSFLLGNSTPFFLKLGIERCGWGIWLAQWIKLLLGKHDEARSGARNPHKVGHVSRSL